MGALDQSTAGEVTGFTSSPDGTIAFVEVADYGSVSVLLQEPYWHRANMPLKGEMLILSDLTRFRKGWRAKSARKYELGDD